MPNNIYRIFDQKSKTYGSLFVSKFDETAKREFSIAVNSERGMMAQFPEDFMLMHVGIDNELNGKIIACDERAVINGMHLVEHHHPNNQPFPMTNGDRQLGLPETGAPEYVAKETTPTNSGSKP